MGTIILGHKVAETVGFEITHLAPIQGFAANIATSLTIHFFTMNYFPVSTTHALVGAITGVGIARGVNIVNFKLLGEIVFAWICTPVFTAIVTFLVFICFNFVKTHAGQQRRNLRFIQSNG